MVDIKPEAVENILNSSSSERILIKTLSVYKIRKTNFVENGLILVLCTIIALILGINPNIIVLVENSISIFLNVSLTLFGIIFTGYAIFQALLSNKLTLSLFEDT